MKNTSFKRLWTKTSVRRIRKEFIKNHPHTGSSFICHNSVEFKKIWHVYWHKLLKLAKRFNKIDIGNVDVLFENSSYECRLDFLDHEIRRLSKKKK
jgi:hypothetical protein